MLTLPTLTLDRPTASKKRRGQVRPKRAERQYATALKQVASQVGSIVSAFAPGDPEAVPRISQILQRYAEALTVWAEATAHRMLTEVDQVDRTQWATLSAQMSETLKREIASAPTGEILQARLAEQVTLIKSLPLEAAQRVHELTLRGLETASRGEEIRRAILATGDVTTARATLIARTEVARTASLLTQSRAEFVGSDGYIWRTSGDSDVRHSHDEMNGRYVRWDTPPRLSDGTVTHAGQIFNCRCYPEPVIPE